MLSRVVVQILSPGSHVPVIAGDDDNDAVTAERHGRINRALIGAPVPRWSGAAVARITVIR